MDINKANEQVSGGPGVIELGGTTFLVGQPDDRTFTTLMSWLKERKKTAPRPLQAIAPDLSCLSPEDRASAIKAAVALQSDGEAEMTERYVQSQLMTPDGAAFLTWLCVRKEQPDVKLADIRPHVTDENMIEVLAKLMEGSGLEAVVAGKLGRAGSLHGGGSPGSTSTAAALKNPTAG